MTKTPVQPRKEKSMTSDKLILLHKHPKDALPHSMCVKRGLGDTLNKQRRKPNGYPGALLATSSITLFILF